MSDQVMNPVCRYCLEDMPTGDIELLEEIRQETTYCFECLCRYGLGEIDIHDCEAGHPSNK